MKIFGSPFRYIQGAGIIHHIGNMIGPLGEHFLLVADGMVIKSISNQISNSLNQAQKHCHTIRFGGEWCNSEISRIIQKALEALQAVDTGIVNQTFEDVVEATILLSGLGFENGGLAAAHAISSGFTDLEQARGAMHGEMVAFGLLDSSYSNSVPRSF